jgi:hypothetical protein
VHPEKSLSHNLIYLLFHDAICFFVAFCLTDFVRIGFESSRLSLANHATSDSVLLATFYTDSGPLCLSLLSAFLFQSLGSQELSAAMRFVSQAARNQNAPLTGSDAARRTADGR